MKYLSFAAPLSILCNIVTSAAAAASPRLSAVDRTSASPSFITARQTVAAPAVFNITGIIVNGNGCPEGSAIYVLSADRQSVTITFSDFGAEVGPGIPLSLSEASCQVTLGIEVPSGFSFAVTTVDYRGFYELDPAVTATQSTLYYFQSALQESTARGNMVGPIVGDEYTFRDTFNITETNFSPCGEATVMNMNSILQVNNAANPQGSGLITSDSIDAALTQTVNFLWMACPT